ncbi:MAG: hypothetical protein ACLQF0_12035 [Dissulfurispiraceae bacterium]
MLAGQFASSIAAKPGVIRHCCPNMPGTFLASARIIINTLSGYGGRVEDNEVILRVRRGDIEAFSILVEKYHRRLLNFIF